MARTFAEPVDVQPDLAEIVLEVVEQLAEPGRQAGMFGPPVPITAQRTVFEWALALSGRTRPGERFRGRPR